MGAEVKQPPLRCYDNQTDSRFVVGPSLVSRYGDGVNTRSVCIPAGTAQSFVCNSLHTEHCY